MTKFLLLALLSAAPALAGVIDDSDLAPPPSAVHISAEGRLEPHARVFGLAGAAKASIMTGQAAARGRIMLLDAHGAKQPARLAKVRLVGPGASGDWTPVGDDGAFLLPVAGLNGRFAVEASLDNPFWSFKNLDAGTGYAWESEPFQLSGEDGADLGDLSPRAGSDNAKLGVLHLTYLRALDFLRGEGDVSWWRRPLTVNWPGAGDFFSSSDWSVDLTNPLAWDVDLHELGHAVMSGAMGDVGAGGEHKIDGCYSEGLAWSEGWATFFAAAVALDRADADARFEFLVPRRAPIRIENVPDDVCKGTTNEWRVAAGFWDLLDTHDDGRDQFSMPFSEIWKALRGHRTTDVLQAWALVAKRLNPAERAAALGSLAQNTLVPAAPQRSIPVLPLLTAPWAQPALAR